VFVLLGCAVVLLLALFATTLEVHEDMESAVSFYAAFFESESIFECDAAQSETLLIGRDT
jgi:hypothetical protein